MKSPYVVVFITTPQGREARKLATAIVKGRLAACVNTLPKVGSLYWWRGKLERTQEALLLVKTRRALLPALIRLVKKIHPYEVPEIIALPIQAGHQPYLAWLKKETRKV